MITCSKTLQIPVKNASWMHMTLNIVTFFQKAKTPISWKQNLFFEKGQIYLQIVNPLHEKCTWPFKKLHGKKKLQYASRISASNRTISKYKWTNALGFELQSAPNLHRDKKIKVLNFKVHQTCTGTKKKVLNFKVHQTCTGTKKTKKNKNFRGIVAPSQVDCEVFVFFVFFVPVQVWCTLKFKTFVFFVPVQVWCSLKFKTCPRFGGLWSPTPCLKPAQGQKNQSFELQSAPNLHRDKKNKSFELQSAPNLHRDKKTKKKQKL